MDLVVRPGGFFRGVGRCQVRVRQAGQMPLKAEQIVSGRQVDR
jgi:hypothetical protein